VWLADRILRDQKAALALTGRLRERQIDLLLVHQLDRHLARDMGRLPSFLNVCHQDRCPVSSPYHTLWFLK